MPDSGSSSRRPRPSARSWPELLKNTIVWKRGSITNWKGWQRNCRTLSTRYRKDPNNGHVGCGIIHKWRHRRWGFVWPPSLCHTLTPKASRPIVIRYIDGSSCRCRVSLNSSNPKGISNDLLTEYQFYLQDKSIYNENNIWSEFQLITMSSDKGEGVPLLVQFSINLKLGDWKGENKSCVFQSHLLKSWLTIAQAVMYLPSKYIFSWAFRDEHCNWAQCKIGFNTPPWMQLSAVKAASKISSQDPSWISKLSLNGHIAVA